MSVVVGCWCGRKRRRQQYQVDIPEKGIPDNNSSGEQQLSLGVSLLDERKVGTAWVCSMLLSLTAYLCIHNIYVCMCTLYSIRLVLSV